MAGFLDALAAPFQGPAPFSSPEEIDAVVASGNLDPQAGERAKARFFPNSVSAPATTVTGTPVEAFESSNAPIALSENTEGLPAVAFSEASARPSIGTTSKQESAFTKMDPAALRGAEQATTEYARSAADVMAATIVSNDAIAEQKASLAIQRFDDVERDKNRRELETAELEGRRNNIRSEIDDLTGKKVNSGRFYQNMGTGDKVLAAISVALGGFASAMQGKPGENAALAIIDKAVDRDIQEQIKNIENSRQTLALKDQDLARLIQITGSKQAARDALMAKQYETLAANLDARAAKSPDGMIQKRAKELADQLRMKVAEKRLDVEKSVTQTTSITAPLKGAGTGVKDVPAETRMKFAGAKNAVADLKDLRSVVDEVGPIEGRLDKIGSRLGVSGPEAAVALSRQVATLISAANAAMPGTLTEQDMKRYEQVVPSLASNPKAFNAVLDDLIRKAERAYDNNLSVFPSEVYETRGLELPVPIKQKKLGQ